MRHSVIEEMMYGKLQDAYEMPPSARLRKASLDAYAKLKSVLTEEQKKLLDEFLDRDAEESEEHDNYILRLASVRGIFWARRCSGRTDPSAAGTCARFAFVLRPFYARPPVLRPRRAFFLAFRGGI